MLLAVVLHAPSALAGGAPRMGDWNGDGIVTPADIIEGHACHGGPGVEAPAGCAVLDFDGDGDVDLADVSAFHLAAVQCGLGDDELEPADWIDTGPDHSLETDDALFRYHCLDGALYFGTDSTAPDIHSHFSGAGSLFWSGYDYTGQMRLADPNGGIGVTFYSNYPDTDHYYRLWRSASQLTWTVTPHGIGLAPLTGDTDTGVLPIANVPYAFHLQVRNVDDVTVIRARVWPADLAEPAEWQVECYDTGAVQLLEGTIGVWAMGPGSKYWRDLSAIESSCTADADSDGLADCHDACPTDPQKSLPGDCGCSVSDADTDLDGTPDCQDQCPQVPDFDSDSDGLADCQDLCPFDPLKSAPQVCGCGTPEDDLDQDGVPDCVDADNICLTTHELNFGNLMTLQGLQIWSCDSNGVNYAVVSRPSWLGISPASGTSTGERDQLWASVSRGALAPGRHVGKVVIRDVATGREAWLTATVNKTTLTPIARWDVVPRQRIGPGETFKCGVVAFSKAGIQRVRFSIEGGGYLGPSPIDVTAPTLNPRTGVWEYWIPLDAADFTTAGEITVSASVLGADGGVRDAATVPGTGLEPLILHSAPAGTSPANVAWVDLAGDDASGAVNNPNRPYARISKALQALAAYQGGYADGGVVRLRPGMHEADNGGVFSGEIAATDREWVTITHDPAAGGTRENTGIDRRGEGALNSRWLKVSGLTLSAGEIINGGGAGDSERRTRSVWLTDCVIIGGPEERPFPIGGNWVGPQYVTECSITGQRRASGYGQNQRLMRNLSITENREDVFQAVPFALNITVDGVDPGDGPDPEHADVIQSAGGIQGDPAGMHNWIFYNIVATDLHYQAVFARTGAPALDNAFVNCFFEMRAPVRVGGIGTAVAGMYDHLLFWQCSFVGTGFQHETALGRPESLTLPAEAWLMANFSVRGCLIDRYVCDVGPNLFNNPDVEFRDNHYVSPGGVANTYTPDTAGGTITIGDPQIVTDPQSPDFGKPADASSPLVDRVTPPLAPTDARGTPRGASGDVGALEH